MNLKIVFKNKNNNYNSYNRLNGPSVIWSDGIKMYYLNNILHRIDGPAIVHNVYKSFWLNGKRYSEKDYYEKLKEINNENHI